MEDEVPLSTCIIFPWKYNLIFILAFKVGKNRALKVDDWVFSPTNLSIA